ncbi:FecR domain-containing protein [Pelagibius sp. Alg239-R121]|uniref:FecR domain-containing protein n=1 Tax=Pelagibius sp. Alg239-R121 TaxID=2993448 RepID=UPI0024A70771|nr:FecR domain-containing protein [Pelagibius sp. Alg239-R121]
MALSLGDQSGGGVTETAHDTTVYLSADEQPTLPGGNFAFDAEFSRHNDDLVLRDGVSDDVVVKDYFGLPQQPDLWTEGGHLFPHQLVQKLAGSLTPAQYAATEAVGGADEIGKVATIEGEAWVTRTDGVKENLDGGASIFQGDVLETAGDGILEIIFVDGMEFSMSTNTRITIDEMIYNPEGSEGSSILSVVKGSFVFVTGWIAGTSPDAMEVKTPSGTIGIRGTRVGCRIDSQDGTTACALLEDGNGHVGSLAFTNAADSVVLNQLFETVVALNFNGNLDAQVLSEVQVRSLLGVLYDQAALETDAPPVTKSSGSVFLPPDFDVGNIEGLEALVALGVLDKATATTSIELTRPLSEQDFTLLEDPMPVAAISVDEAIAIGEGAVTGNLGFSATGNSSDSIRIDGLSVTSGGDPAALTSGGDAILTRIENDGQQLVGFVPASGSGPQAGKEIFLLAMDSSAGTFEFTLLEALDHLDPAQSSTADSLELSFAITAQLDVVTVTSRIDVSVLDDAPKAVDNIAAPRLEISGNGNEIPSEDEALPEGTEEGPNGQLGLLIAIDVSTSMNSVMTLANGEQSSRLELAKAAAENLGRKLFEVGSQTGVGVTLSLMVFADGAEALSPLSGFTDFTSFATSVRSVTDANGYPGVNNGTNFFGAVEAIEGVAQQQLISDPSESASNSIYFISDGFVTTGRSVAESGWEDFLTEKGITSIAVAVDPGDESLAPLLDVNSPDQEGDPIILTGVDDLSSDFTGSIQPVSEGNLLLDAQDSNLGLLASDVFGADGFLQLLSLEVDGAVYDYDAGSDQITSDAGVATDGPQLSIQTALGGQFDFDFSTGDYRYQGPEFDHETERFSYQVADGDGDRATAALIVNPDSYSFSLTQHPAGSYTLFGFDPNQDLITISDVLDSDQDGDSDIADLAALGVTLSQNAVTGTVTLQLDSDTSIVLDGIRDSISSLEELDNAVNLALTT